MSLTWPSLGEIRITVGWLTTAISVVAATAAVTAAIVAWRSVESYRDAAMLETRIGACADIASGANDFDRLALRIDASLANPQTAQRAAEDARRISRIPNDIMRAWPRLQLVATDASAFGMDNVARPMAAYTEEARKRAPDRRTLSRRRGEVAAATEAFLSACRGRG